MILHGVKETLVSRYVSETLVPRDVNEIGMQVIEYIFIICYSSMIWDL